MTSLSRHFCDQQTLLRPDIALSKHCCAQTLVHPGADESRRCGVWSTGSNRHHFLTAIGELGELKTQLRPDADTLWAGLIKISLKFVTKGPINNIPALVQIMAWRWPGDKPLSEPMMISLLMHICVTWPQWVKDNKNLLIIQSQPCLLMTWQQESGLQQELYWSSSDEISCCLGDFKHMFELLILRALKFSKLHKNCIFQCRGMIFWVEF